MVKLFSYSKIRNLERTRAFNKYNIEMNRCCGILSEIISLYNKHGDNLDYEHLRSIPVEVLLIRSSADYPKYNDFKHDIENDPQRRRELISIESYYLEYEIHDKDFTLDFTYLLGADEIHSVYYFDSKNCLSVEYRSDDEYEFEYYGEEYECREDYEEEEYEEAAPLEYEEDGEAEEEEDNQNE